MFCKCSSEAAIQSLQFAITVVGELKQLSGSCQAEVPCVLGKPGGLE